MEITFTPDMPHPYSYAFEDTPDPPTLAVLGSPPSRWGRMPPLCKAMIVETGKFLEKFKNDVGYSLTEQGKMIGLIGGTTRGSLAPDLDFARTLCEGVNMASPAIFGYTLANIPLAETANHYHLTGPVYALIDEADPLAAAVREARRLVRMQPALHAVIACAFDDLPHRALDKRLTVTFALVDNNA
jgi:hypothetical protein